MTNSLIYSRLAASKTELSNYISKFIICCYCCLRILTLRESITIRRHETLEISSNNLENVKKLTKTFLSKNNIPNIVSTSCKGKAKI